MVFSAAIYANTTMGNVPAESPAPVEGPILDLDDMPSWKQQAADKHDAVAYTMHNTPIIALAGMAAGLQEAYYKFERMSPAETRNSLGQASTLFRIVGRKTLFGAALGAIFCFTEATVENIRGKHDMTNGMIAGAAAGLAFGLLPPKPMPQPLAWPLAFAAVAAGADILGEKIPNVMKTTRSYGPLEGRPSWNDPAPPRPPILETGAAARPMGPQQFWRGA